jgi:hypothetical protein
VEEITVEVMQSTKEDEGEQVELIHQEWIMLLLVLGWENLNDP